MPSMDFLAKGGDPFMDLAPHDLDYVRWVVNSEPVRVWAQGSSSTSQLAARYTVLAIFLGCWCLLGSLTQAFDGIRLLLEILAKSLTTPE